MDPDEISRELDMEAEHSFRAGERRRSRSGVSDSVYAESYWLGVLKPAQRVVDFSFPGNPKWSVAQQPLEEATGSLGWALSISAAIFFKRHAQSLQRIRAEGGQVSLLVTISGGEVNSFTLAPQASRLFGELGITVEFELAAD